MHAVAQLYHYPTGLEEREQLRAARLGQLRRDIQAGIESGSAGDLDIADIKRRGRSPLARHKSR